MNGQFEEKLPLYEKVAGKINFLIEKGTLRPGDKVPSIRNLSKQMQVSINTVKEAYSLLEDRRLLEARPQSGYYVRVRLPELPAEYRRPPTYRWPACLPLALVEGDASPPSSQFSILPQRDNCS